MKVQELDLQLPIRRGSVEFCAATEADHEAIYQTLLHVFHGPDREAFLGALGDPAYRPEQRLLVKVEGRIVSHLHLTERVVRYGCAELKLNGVMWVATLPEYRGLGYAQNLLRLAAQRGRDSGAFLQTLTTSMPQFYRPLGWAVCGRHSFGQSPSRNLPPWIETAGDTKGGAWQVRPWRQVELAQLMGLYEQQYGGTTGAIVRSEEYWRWLIGRRYANVIWVACEGETVRGYAFVKDHRILEIATDPEYPVALRLLVGRVRSEALERAYPEVVAYAPAGHPVLELFQQAPGKIIDQEEWEGSSTMYSITDVEGFLSAIGPQLLQRARANGGALPLELGLAVSEKRWLVRLKASGCRIEPEKLSRRHLKLTPAAFVRLVMGHSGIDRAMAEEGVEVSATTAVDAARVLFPITPIWRSPLDSATA